MGRFNSNKFREADKLTKEVGSWSSRYFSVIQKTKIRSWKAVALLAFVAGSIVAIFFLISANIQTTSDAMSQRRSPLMKQIKIGGCVADGILSNYGGKAEIEAEMIKRSECKYLHRALETWAHPPDFKMAEEIMENIKEEKPKMIFGMFLAEAVNPDSSLYFPEEQRYFNFSAMCKDGSEGFWGEKTCKGNFGSSEYRKYLKYITEKAIDMGIQSFLIGQIFFQDNGTGWRSWAKDIVGDMREYAEKRGREIVVGAQTNDIREEKYLRIFDFIEGGVGLSSEGRVEEGPCFSRWWKKEGDRCWALLWHPNFKNRANDVIVHLDWSGFYSDDMSTFARLEREKRKESMGRLKAYFGKKDVGFLLPYLAVINENNGSCFGPAKNYYSASNDYSCQDEDSFNSIIKKALIKNDARYVGQNILKEMVAGEKYRAEIIFINSGDSSWSRENDFYLAPKNPQDSNIWRGRVDFEPGEIIRPGETARFIFEIKAPPVTGVYDFQWQMMDEGLDWFGEKSENLKINVVPYKTKNNVNRNDSGSIQ